MKATKHSILTKGIKKKKKIGKHLFFNPNPQLTVNGVNLITNP